MAVPGSARLAAVTTWRCGGNLPASFLAADGHGDAFFYDPGLFVTHDGGRTWASAHQPGTVLAIATAGRSAWMVRADCPRHGRTCALRLLESADGGRAWAASPAQPPGATVRAVGGQPAQEGAAGQTWLLRTGRSSAYRAVQPGRRRRPVLVHRRRRGRPGPRARSGAGRSAPSRSRSRPRRTGRCWPCAPGSPVAGFQAKSAGRSTDGGRSWTVHTPCPVSRMACRRGMPLDSGYLAQIDAVSAGHHVPDRRPEFAAGHHGRRQPVAGRPAADRGLRRRHLRGDLRQPPGRVRPRRRRAEQRAAGDLADHRWRGALVSRAAPAQVIPGDTGTTDDRLAELTAARAVSFPRPRG